MRQWHRPVIDMLPKTSNLYLFVAEHVENEFGVCLIFEPIPMFYLILEMFGKIETIKLIYVFNWNRIILRGQFLFNL